MMKVLGLKRILTLAILLGLNAMLAITLYFFIIPGEDQTSTDLRSTRSAVEVKRGEIKILQTQYQEIQEQKTLFGDLDHSGFFGTQDRVEARRTIEAIQHESHVLSAKYNINAVAVKENPLAMESEHVLLQSPVSVKVDALDDMDVYSFLYWIENAFPGSIVITNVTIERKIDIDENALKSIGNGIPAALISANVDFAWSTFVPKADLPQQLGQPGTPQ
jgi:hypothetical protein